MTTDVPEEMYEVPIGKAEVVRQGTDFTILAMGRMVLEALAAAKTLEADGLSVEVIDIRSVQPFDTETAVASLKKRTGHWWCMKRCGLVDLVARS